MCFKKPIFTFILAMSRHISSSQQKLLILKHYRAPLLGILLVKLKIFHVSYSNFPIFFAIEGNLFPTSLQVPFDSIKNKFACKNIFLVCYLPFILFTRFYHKEVLQFWSNWFFFLKSIFLVLLSFFTLRLEIDTLLLFYKKF